MFFPWHLCILPFLKVPSSVLLSLRSPTCTSASAVFPSGSFFPIQNLCGSDLYSVLLPSSLAVWSLSEFTSDLSTTCPWYSSNSLFPKHLFPKSKRKQQRIKPSSLWDAWGLQSRPEVPVGCRGPVLPIRFAAFAFRLLLLSWAASGSARPEKEKVRAFPAPSVISPHSNPKSLTQGGSRGSGKQWGGWPALIQRANEK